LSRPESLVETKVLLDCGHARERVIDFLGETALLAPNKKRFTAPRMLGAAGLWGR